MEVFSVVKQLEMMDFPLPGYSRLVEWWIYTPFVFDKFPIFRHTQFTGAAKKPRCACNIASAARW